MADAKISELSEHVGSDLVADDLLVVVDTSTTTTKKLQYEGLLLPTFGEYVESGVNTNPTYFADGATFDANQANGFYVGRRDHHGGRELTWVLYSATTDQPVGKVLYSNSAQAASLANGGTAIVGTTAYIESSDGSNYIDFEQAVSMEADGGAMSGYLYIDCAEYPAGGNTQVGIVSNQWKIRGRLLSGQTAAPIQIQAVGGATLFEVSTASVITVPETSDPSAAAAGFITVYAKDTGGVARLYLRDDTAVKQLAVTTDIPTVAGVYLPLAAGGASVEDVGAIESNVNTVGASGSTETLDVSVYAVHDITMDQACIFTFSNPAPSGDNSTFMLILRGAFTPTLPNSIDWADASAPTYTTPSVYVFTTVDAGTTWLGQQVGAAFG